MKYFLPVFIFIAFSLSGFSQTLKLTHGVDSTIVNYGDTLVVVDSATVSEMSATIFVKNTDTVSNKVYCEKQYINEVSGTINTFCWGGLCYQPTTFLSTNFAIIQAGATNTEFVAHYEPSANVGTTIIRYVFRIVHGDTADFYVKFIGTTGIDDNKLMYSISEPYPNPSSNVTTINYSIPFGSKAILQVMSICGKIEKQYSLNESNGALKMNISDLSSGIYFCSLTIDNKVVKTSKLIISH